MLEQAIQLAKEVEHWRKLYDATPKHPDGLGGNEFISVHNRMVMEWRREVERLELRENAYHVAALLAKVDIEDLREALGTIREELADPCGQETIDKIDKIARAALDAQGGEGDE